MGQIALIVVAAAWAAVLLPPLLRSRAENRPNSSVSDFRNQLSSLQRVMPTRSVSVRSMGRSLAPSTLSRPAAPGRPAGRTAKPSPRGQNSFGPTRQGAGRAEQQRMQDASLRTRTHSNRDASAPTRRPAGAMTPAMVAKRRRTNVLFVLVLTTASGGFLAATTGSDAMVLLFAAGMIGLGGYVYMLITLNQRESGGVSPAVAARQARAQRYAAAQRGPAPRDPLVRDWTPAEGYEYGDLDDGSYDSLYSETRPVDRRPASGGGDYNYVPAPPRGVPGSGQSGRISYGRPAAVKRAAASPDPYAAPMPRDPRDPFGREQQGREITRGTQVRNGRHATGQHPVQQRQPQPYSRNRTRSSAR